MGRRQETLCINRGRYPWKSGMLREEGKASIPLWKMSRFWTVMIAGERLERALLSSCGFKYSFTKYTVQLAVMRRLSLLSWAVCALHSWECGHSSTLFTLLTPKWLKHVPSYPIHQPNFRARLRMPPPRTSPAGRTAQPLPDSFQQLFIGTHQNPKFLFEPWLSSYIVKNLFQRNSHRCVQISNCKHVPHKDQKRETFLKSGSKGWVTSIPAASWRSSCRVAKDNVKEYSIHTKILL